MAEPAVSIQHEEMPVTHVQSQPLQIKNSGRIARTIARAVHLRHLQKSRKIAIQWREKLIRAHGESAVTRPVLQRIKRYAADTYGNESWWPWLAAYTEVRREFVEGWIGDDYYTEHLNPLWNRQDIRRLSGLKTMDSRLFPDSVVPPIFVRVGGQYLDAHGTPEPLDEALSRLEAGKTYVIKPDEGRQGLGVTFTTAEQVAEELGKVPGNCIVQPLIEQHPDIARINASSVNTLRVLTFLDPESGELRILNQFLRLGREGQRTDNVSTGGYFVGVDGDGWMDGHLRDPVCVSIGSIHPDSGVDVKGGRIPNFGAVRKLCLDAHRRIPYLRFIGWDVCIQASGDPVILEWNAEQVAWSRNESCFGPLLPSVPRGYPR